MKTMDLAVTTLRDINQALHDQAEQCKEQQWNITGAKGEHNLACGLDQNLSVEIDGNAGYFCAGMNQQASVLVKGNVGQGVAENMMSGVVRVQGSASQSAGATAHGGMLVINGDAGARCGISLKGAEIVVQGSVGHMSCFMAQAGALVVCGDAGEALGDSLYETQIFVKGSVASLGADCIEKDMQAKHIEYLSDLLSRAEIDDDPKAFKRYGSARQLYNFKVDNASAY